MKLRSYSHGCIFMPSLYVWCLPYLDILSKKCELNLVLCTYSKMLNLHFSCMIPVTSHATEDNMQSSRGEGRAEGCVRISNTSQIKHFYNTTIAINNNCMHYNIEHVIWSIL